MKVDIKTKAEINRMRDACRMTAEIRDICAAAVAPGVTTGEIDDLVIDYCRKHNAVASFFAYPGGRHVPDFPGHLCVSLNDEVIHGIPDHNRVIMPGDLVKTDVGIFCNGFTGDSSRTVALGVTDPEVLKLVETTKRCLKAGIETAGPGVHLGDVGYADDQPDEARRADGDPGQRLDRRHRRPLPLGSLRAHGRHHRRRMRDSHFAGGLSLKFPSPKARRSNGG